MLRDEWIELEGKGCEVVYCDTDSLYFTNPNKVKISESRECRILLEMYNDILTSPFYEMSVAF